MRARVITLPGQKKFRFTITDLVIFLVVSLPSSTLFNIWIFGNQFFHDLQQLTLTTIIAMLACTLIWIMLMPGMYLLRKRFPSFKDTIKRSTYSLLLYSSVTILVALTLQWVYHLSSFYGFQFSTRLFLKTVLICLAANIIYLGTYELIYTLHKWKESLKLKEELEKQRVQHEFVSLKNQVNPHFLFNSLSSLSSLIDDDPGEAEKFLNEMSKVYRYLLRSGEHELTTLSSELQFLASYTYLLKTRYGAGLEINLNISPAYENDLLPQSAIQVVIDQAIRDNTTLKDSPLVINISANDGFLKIRHNMQKKELMVESDTSDLQDIVTRYRIVKLPEVELDCDAGYLEIKMPLIRKSGEWPKPA